MYNIKNIERILLKHKDKFTKEEWDEIEKILASKKGSKLPKFLLILLLKELIKVCLDNES